MEALDAPLRRLNRLLVANHAGIWGSVVVLGVLRLTYTDHPSVGLNIAVLTAGGLVLLAGTALVRQRRMAPGVVLIIVANWICAIGATYASAFITPVGLFGLLVPVILLFEFLSPALLTAFIVLTVIVTGMLAGVGEWRRSLSESLPLEPWLTASFVTFFVVVVVAIVALGLWNQTRRLTEQAAALEASRRRLASAADTARRAIERDLHDGAQQRLSTLAVHLGRVQRLVHDDPAAAEQSLAQAHTELIDAIRELRDLAHGIYPALLERQGLAPALTAAARRVTRPCAVNAPGLGRLPADVENAVYFTCLEAVHNADKHSSAHAIVIDLGVTDGTLGFSVSDDGVGFDLAHPGGTRRLTGKGLTGMADRIRAAGGTLAIDSRPGHGTVVSGRIPLDTALDGDQSR